MLDAIRSARETVNIECYIFKQGEIGDQFIEALAERAQAGVRVTLVLDAIGSFGHVPQDRRAAARAPAAGSSVYQQLTWYRLGRLNNRTHRELLVVDGRVAFAGGAGVADWWAHAAARQADVARHDGAHRGAGRRRTFRASSRRTGSSAAARS